MAQELTKKRMLVGEVISDKMDKTIVVKVERTFIHPLLKKVVKKFKKFKAHDENELANVGDMVEIYEGRPVAKTKYMHLHKVIKHKLSSEKEA